MIWSEEARAVIAEDRMRENAYWAEWEEGRRDAFERDFDEDDDPNALLDWLQGFRP